MLLILGALSFLVSVPARADLPAAERAELEKRIVVYRAQIAQQQRNIAKMTAELQAHPNNPDVRKLGDFFATAAGHRSQAYHDQPPYIRQLIERVEHDPLLGLDNLATGVQNAGNVAVGHFKIEIDRSKKFIALCRRQLRDTQARLDAAAKDPGDAWKSALGRWTDGKGTDVEIEQDADGVQARFTALGGKLKSARAEVGDWLFGNGRPSSDRRGIESVGSSRVDLQACKLEYSIVSPK